MNQQAFGADALNVDHLPFEDASREMEVDPAPAATAPVPAAPAAMVLGPRVLNSEELQEFYELNKNQNELLVDFAKDNQNVSCSSHGQATRNKLFEIVLRQNLEAFGIRKLRPAQVYMLECLWNVDENLVFELGIASGKTTAYVMWVVDTVMVLKQKGENPELRDSQSPYSLVLVPTRELGLQVFKLIRAIIPETGVTVSFFTETKPTENSQKECVMSDIVIATPGHAKLLLESGQLSVASIKSVVLDEVDYMVRKCPEITEVIQGIKKTEKNIKLVAVTSTSSADLRNFLDATLGPVGRGTTKLWAEGGAFLSQRVTFSAQMTGKWGHKFKLLRKTLQDNPERQTLVFISNTICCENLVNQLNSDAVLAASITDRTPNNEIDDLLSSFERGVLKVIVTTDDFCRGLNFLGVENLISFDLPRNSLEVKLRHRLGRVSRITPCHATIFLNLQNEYDNAVKYRFRQMFVEEVQSMTFPMRGWEPRLPEFPENPRVPRRYPPGYGFGFNRR